MPAAEREIFHQFYGPFEQTVFAIFEDLGSGYRVSFDSGPEFNVAGIFADNITAFKFKANTIIELRVSVLYGMKLQFQGTQIPTFSPVPSPTAVGQTSTGLRGLPGDDLTPFCGSIECSQTKKCPDPLTPNFDCDSGECVAGEE